MTLWFLQIYKLWVSSCEIVHCVIYPEYFAEQEIEYFCGKDRLPESDEVETERNAFEGLVLLDGPDDLFWYFFRIEDREDIKPVENRENMFYSTEDVIIAETIKIADVYEEFLKYESEGKLVILRYNEQPVERQNELVDFIAQGLSRSGFFEGNEQKQEFMKKHFPKSWEKAKNAE